MLVRRVAAYSIIILIDQVSYSAVKAHAMSTYQREKKVLTTHRVTAAAAPAALCVWLLDCSDETSIIDDRTYF